ncbi:hypothetical protein C440_04288 [Haloferax mucosum ATCC BAA-1512]|uniref:DUF7978 domain-containing protein n=1 Tax=Haloferax mucosum ATCC BAA-1512 TaxID=662479 RepID=M0IJN5_9EURY|nr:hypothetical protein [Haloferax mucosum]ELZ96965.1 hypothetical protein C440_04288 [Haloferax mucosum ATCC BAA-1512]
MSSPRKRRPLRTDLRPLLLAGFVAGVGAFVVGVAAVALWLAVALDGSFPGLTAKTGLTGGKRPSALVLPVWTFVGAVGVPVQLVETTGGGTLTLSRNLVTVLDGPDDSWWWLGALPPVCLALAGLLAARFVGRVQQSLEGFVAGSTVAAGFAAAMLVASLVVRVGLGDVPPNHDGIVRIGATGIPPQQLDDDSIGIPLWGTFTAIFLSIGAGGFGGLVAATLPNWLTRESS